MNLGFSCLGAGILATTPAAYVSIEKAPQQSVIEISSLDQMPQEFSHYALVLVDLDETAFKTSTMLGSKAWRQYIKKASAKIDNSKNWHDIISLGLAAHHPYKTVEPQTSQCFKNLQAKGYVVAGFTARERTKWYDMDQAGVDAMTVQQLNQVEIDFNNKSLENTYFSLSQDSEYYQGVFFANKEDKGQYLDRLLSHTCCYPTEIVFIDDKASHVHSVGKIAEKYGIPYKGYVYTATAQDPFNERIANIQLYHLFRTEGKTLLTDEEAKKIAQDDPNKSADQYLKEALEIGKSTMMAPNPKL